MNNEELKALVKIEVEQENLSKQFDKHEILDNDRFDKITDKIDLLSKNQNKLMAYGVAAFSVMSFLINHAVKFFGA